MTGLPVTRELQPLVGAHARRRAEAQTGRSSLAALVGDPNFKAVVIFALTGLVATLGATVLLPPATAAAVLAISF